MSEPFDLVGLGETMVSLIATEGPLTTATTFHATHGGAETNTLIGMARLGARTAWVGRLGDDAMGGRIERDLTAEGVDLRWVRSDPERPTGVMIRDTQGGVSYRRAGSAASAMTPADLDDVPLTEPGAIRAVLVTGVTALIGDGPQRTAATLLQRAVGLRVVDPNLRPGLWGSDRAPELITPLVRRCDLLLGGRHELAAIIGDTTVPATDPRTLAERCQALGPGEVVVKRGSEGAGVLDEQGSWTELEPSPAQERDPVGAGDAFNAGYLFARLAGNAPEAALSAGAAAGAAAASSFGDAIALDHGAGNRGSWSACAPRYASTSDSAVPIDRTSGCSASASTASARLPVCAASAVSSACATTCRTRPLTSGGSEPCGIGSTRRAPDRGGGLHDGARLAGPSTCPSFGRFRMNRPASAPAASPPSPRRRSRRVPRSRGPSTAPGARDRPRAR